MDRCMFLVRGSMNVLYVLPLFFYSSSNMPMPMLCLSLLAHFLCNVDILFAFYGGQCGVANN